jgi:hypothetical protein
LNVYSYKTTLLDLWNTSGKTNILAAFFGFGVFIYILIRESDLSSALELGGVLSDQIIRYRDQSIFLWVINYCAFVYAFTIPMIRIRKQPFGKEITTIALGLFFVLGIFLLITIPVRLEQEYFEVLTNMGPVIAGIFGLLILLIQLQNASYARRSNNSMQALLQMRMSDVQQQHLKTVNDEYPARLGSVISNDDVEKYHTTNFDEADKELQKKIKAINSQIYLLNYFEFLSYGIKAYTFDEELLYGTLAHIVLQHHNRGQNIIKTIQKKEPKCFSSLSDLHRKWSVRRAFESNTAK